MNMYAGDGLRQAFYPVLIKADLILRDILGTLNQPIFYTYLYILSLERNSSTLKYPIKYSSDYVTPYTWQDIKDNPSQFRVVVDPNNRYGYGAEITYDTITYSTPYPISDEGNVYIYIYISRYICRN